VAIAALKRKKQYEAQIDKISGARMTIETQMMAIESANINLETMNAMKAGAQAIKQIHGSMSIEQVDKTMDDIRDQMDLANEISDAIAQPLSFGAEIDEVRKVVYSVLDDDDDDDDDDDSYVMY
jgi:charged multivesicular body protein 4